MPGQGMYGALVGIIPGAVATNLARHLSPEALQASAAVLRATPDVSLLLQPDDIARAVLFAVSQPTTVSIDEITVNPQADIQPRMR
ncbi:hypothetical protein ABTY98_02215 [Streptomyces sp. NPDC096040]|uniref:hypothetical protein n=1 Tax=Streptomyces sp. NPDC096040 TaxID=3155541 RepID=UPI00332E9641